MHETFFNHVNIPRQNIPSLTATLNVEEVEAFCADYERKIKAAGGIDIQVLGIRPHRPYRFNEPGSPRNSRTRMATLDSITRRDASGGFFGEENVAEPGDHDGRGEHPGCRRIFLMAFGEHKAGVVAKAVEQPPTEAISASSCKSIPTPRWSWMRRPRRTDRDQSGPGKWVPANGLPTGSAGPSSGWR